MNLSDCAADHALGQALGSVKHLPHGLTVGLVLAETLDRATETLLQENKGPARKVGQIDNRGSHFYLALYWAQELAKQTEDTDLASAFSGVSETLTSQESRITEELLAVQGQPADIGGYYRPDEAKVTAVMRPSSTFNDALTALR